MNLKSWCIALLLVGCGAAQAACLSLLEVLGADGAPLLSLNRCEVQVDLQTPGMRGQVMFRLLDPAAQRWRDALKVQSPLWSAMLDAKARVRSDGILVPQGVLLEAYSARLLPQPMWLWDSRAATLRLAMGSGAAPVPTPPALADCSVFQTGSLIFWFEPRDTQAGEMISHQPVLVRAPHDFLAVPRACISGWRLSPGAPAQIEPVSGIGVVAQDAADGTTFTLMAQVGTQIAEGRMRVVDAAKHPLRGLWRQTREIACGTDTERVPVKPLRELRFTGADRFTATWTPFESYIDYAGTFTYDAEKKALELVVTSGNDLPAQRSITATATLLGERRLRISALPGGPRNPQEESVCQMIFARD